MGLSGLGLRIHWSSAQLILRGLTNVLATDLIGADSLCQDDSQTDFDHDTRTDCYAQVAWASPRGRWPRALPTWTPTDGASASKDSHQGRLPLPGPLPSPSTRLFTADFTARLSPSQSTTVNFSASATAVGYELKATSATIRAGLAESGPQTGGAAVSVPGR